LIAGLFTALNLYIDGLLMLIAVLTISKVCHLSGEFAVPRSRFRSIKVAPRWAAGPDASATAMESVMERWLEQGL
jgi:hypothetical protein